MDDEQSFAALLRSTTPASRPTWDAPSSSNRPTAGTVPSNDMSADPWANPFASSPTAPFGTPDVSIPRIPAVPDLPSPAFGSGSNAGGFDYDGFGSVYPSTSAGTGGQGQGGFIGQTVLETEKESPYVQQLQAEGLANPTTSSHTIYTDTVNGSQVDPPSVIAAREREALSAQQAVSHQEDDSAFVAAASVYDNGSSTVAQTDFTDDPFAQPFASPSRPFDVSSYPDPEPVPFNSQSVDQPSQSASATTNAASTAVPTKKLPAGLIDEDLLAESDPMLSLKKAFVKSDTSSLSAQKAAETKQQEIGTVRRAADKGKKTYTFNHAPKAAVKDQSKPVNEGTGQSRDTLEDVAEGKAKDAQEKPVEQTKKAGLDGASDKTEDARTVYQVSEVAKQERVEEQDDVEVKYGTAPASKAASSVQKAYGVDSETSKLSDSAATPVQSSEAPESSVPPVIASSTEEPTKQKTLRPASIPLPPSTLTSPGLSRESTPPPSHIQAEAAARPPMADIETNDIAPPIQTPYDRVAVSPLEGPTRASTDGMTGDFGIDGLSIQNGHSQSHGQAIAQEAMGGWGNGDVMPASNSSIGDRFGGKGWGAVDDLFGEKRGDPWGGSEEQSGWQDEAGPSISPAPPTETTPPSDPSPRAADSSLQSAPSSTRTSPVKPRRKTHPVFTVSIGDPTRMGDPVRGYTVYTVRTHTTSPHYRKSDLTALRRFSDFLWLFEALVSNNPGIIIPPVPDKHTFGRFQEQFIETRRLALERSLSKITSHPVLQLDPDLRLFLESDNFAAESKMRRPVTEAVHVPEQRGLLSGWTGPKFVESDDWFNSRLSFLDSLETQLRALSKSVEVSSKARLDYAIVLGESAEAMARLAESDLGSAMCAALARLADLGRTEKEAAEELAKGDVVNLLNVADEYIRFIASVKTAMQARVKGWLTWQAHLKEASRFKATREKMRAQGKLGDRAAQSLAEANELLNQQLDRRAQDAERDYETTSKVIKSEFARFERERVEEFKRTLERWLDVQILKQKEVIEAWEEYHGVVLKMVQKAQGKAV